MRIVLLMLVSSLTPVFSAAEDLLTATALPADLSIDLRQLPPKKLANKPSTTAYVNLFNPDTGLGFKEDLPLHEDRRWRVGGYTSVGLDLFTDDTGNALKPDDVTVLSALVGGKSRLSFGPGFFGDGYLGFGVARGAVDATGSGVPSPELFTASNSLALEAGARLGWGTPRFATLLGLGYRYMGSGRDKDASEITPARVLDLGVQYAF